MKKILIIIGSIFLLLVLLVMCRSGDASEKGDARRAIELCWKEQGRKSFDPATARFVAGACEMMEKEFKAKYRVDP